MANMSYCRFENTSRELGDCVGVMREAYDLAELNLSDDYELPAFNRMIRLCKQFLKESDRLMAAESVDFDE